MCQAWCWASYTWQHQSHRYICCYSIGLLSLQIERLASFLVWLTRMRQLKKIHQGPQCQFWQVMFLGTSLLLPANSHLLFLPPHDAPCCSGTNEVIKMVMGLWRSLIRSSISILKACFIHKCKDFSHKDTPQYLIYWRKWMWFRSKAEKCVCCITTKKSGMINSCLCTFSPQKGQPLQHMGRDE